MSYQEKRFTNLENLLGLSEKLIAGHITLYQGYIKNVNQLLELLDSKEPGTLEYSELQRRFGWEWNGMRLHELYFDNLSKESAFNPESELGKKILNIYGTFENWQKNFASVGAMRGIGWVVLYFDKTFGELFNVWVNEHDTGHLSGCEPLLVMDVFEHAYMLDYGLKKADYIEEFFKIIDWQVVEDRFNK